MSNPVPDNPFTISQPKTQQKQNQPKTQNKGENPFSLNKSEQQIFNVTDEPPFDVNVPPPNVPPPNANQELVNENLEILFGKKPTTVTDAQLDEIFNNPIKNQVTTENEPVVQNQQPKLNLEGGVSMQNQNPTFSSPAPQQGFNPAPQQGFNPTPQQGFNPTPQPTGFGGGQPPTQAAQGFGGGQQPQAGFGGGQPPAQGFGGGGNQQQTKYNIVDLYWFINKKLFSNKPLDQNEAGLMTIGFNASFGNLRLSLHGIDNNSFTASSVIMENCPRLAICNIHAETAAQLLASKQSNQPVQLIERVIKAGNWTPNVSQIIWQTNIIVNSQDQHGNVHTFTLLDDQIKAFESALGFMIDGNAWLASLMSVITRNS